MGRDKRISAIIPTYNRIGFLEKTLRSILQQTHPCDEIILVDDGSTDATKEFVASFTKENKNHNIIYLYQENRGAAAARNRGIEAADSEILCFLDSDDCWHEKKIETQFLAMQEKSDYKISHTREIWYRRGELLQQKKKHQPPDGEIFNACLPMCVVGMSTVMIKKEVFFRHGMFDESLPCCEDYDLWLRIAAHERFMLVNEALTIKDGGRPDQLSVLYRAGMDKYRIQALCHALDRCSLTPAQYKQAVQELEKKCRIYGNGCIKYGRKDEGDFFLQLPSRY